MKGLMGLMERAGLLKLSESEKENVTTVAEPEAVVVAPPIPDAAVMIGDAAPGQVSEDRPLEDIFALAAVAPSPFPAEKLLRLLDGLRAMDMATRKAAVLAMDAADDNWTIADPVTDAQLKISALDVYKTALTKQVDTAEANTSAGVAEIKANLERTSAEIRAQIGELEQLLQREVGKASEDATKLEAALRATRESAAREFRRMDKEIERLSEIPSTFAQSATTN
jgi:hypothetical protein